MAYDPLVEAATGFSPEEQEEMSRQAGGFLENLGLEASEMAQGMSSLMPLLFMTARQVPKKLFGDPEAKAEAKEFADVVLGGMKEIPGEMLADVKGLVDPKRWYEKPLSSALTAWILGGAGKMGLKAATKFGPGALRRMLYKRMPLEAEIALKPEIVGKADVPAILEELTTRGIKAKDVGVAERLLRGEKLGAKTYHYEPRFRLPGRLASEEGAFKPGEVGKFIQEQMSRKHRYKGFPEETGKKIFKRAEAEVSEVVPKEDVKFLRKIVDTLKLTKDKVGTAKKLESTTGYKASYLLKLLRSEEGFAGIKKPKITVRGKPKKDIQAALRIGEGDAALTFTGEDHMAALSKVPEHLQDASIEMGYTMGGKWMNTDEIDQFISAKGTKKAPPISVAKTKRGLIIGETKWPRADDKFVDEEAKVAKEFKKVTQDRSKSEEIIEAITVDAAIDDGLVKINDSLKEVAKQKKRLKTGSAEGLRLDEITSVLKEERGKLLAMKKTVKEPVVEKVKVKRGALSAENQERLRAIGEINKEIHSKIDLQEAAQISGDLEEAEALAKEVRQLTQQAQLLQGQTKVRGGPKLTGPEGERGSFSLKDGRTFANRPNRTPKGWKDPEEYGRGGRYVTYDEATKRSLDVFPDEEEWGQGDWVVKDIKGNTMANGRLESDPIPKPEDLSMKPASKKDWSNYLSRSEPLRDANRVLQKIHEKGYKAYIVGGAVRDITMGKEAKDVDIATNMPMEEIDKLWEPKDIGKSRDFGIVLVKEGNNHFEVAQFRQDGTYLDGRRPETVEMVGTFEKDAERRDFTINAMAIDADGNIIDYFDGEGDIKNKVIRSVGDPKKRFEEDKLRMMRAPRFATKLGFEIEPKTKEAIKEMADKVEALPGERISEEIMKAAEGTGEEFAGYIELLDDLGLLKKILPEVKKMQGFKHGVRQHPEGGVWEHTLAALRTSGAGEPLKKLAIMLHDVGKPLTFEEAGGKISYIGHVKRGMELVDVIGKRLKLSKKQVNALKFAVGEHMNITKVLDMRPSKIFRMVTNEYWDILRAVAEADDLARGTTGEKFQKIIDNAIKIKEKWGEEQNERTLKLVDGNRVMELTGLDPSPDVGRIIKKVTDWILDTGESSQAKIDEQIRKAVGHRKAIRIGEMVVAAKTGVLGETAHYQIIDRLPEAIRDDLDDYIDRGLAEKGYIDHVTGEFVPEE